MLKFFKEKDTYKAVTPEGEVYGYIRFNQDKSSEPTRWLLYLSLSGQWINAGSFDLAKKFLNSSYLHSRKQT